MDRARIYPPLSFRLRDATLREALLATLRDVDPFRRLSVTEKGQVLITSAFKPASVQAEGFEAVLAATRVNLEVRNWPLGAVVEELRERTGLDLRWVDTLDIEVVGVQASQECLDALLRRLLEPRGRRARVEGVTLWIEPRP